MSYGQQLLKAKLHVMVSGTPIENHRPDWLQGLELDFFYPEHRLGFEFQGDQHYLPVFGESNLAAQRQRDELKRTLCKQHGIVLCKVQAWELPKLNLRNKLLSVANWYRGGTRQERSAWIIAVIGGRKRAIGLAEYRGEDAKEYCGAIRAMGGVTSIPIYHSRKREALIKKHWVNQTHPANEQ